MGNSPLISYVKLSPNNSGLRRYKIDTITIHCTAGQTTVEALGNMFAKPSRQASANYGIGYDGRIGMYVEEKDRSWCSSSGANDHRAITIEVSSDNKHPYAVTEKVYKALIDLCADICKRNGIKALLWRGDKSLIGQVDKQNMTVHRWFSAKACPGDYLYSRHGDIARQVNDRLGQRVPVQDAPVTERFTKGDYVTIANARKIGNKVYGTTYNGGSFRMWYGKYKVLSVTGDRALIGIGVIPAAYVNVADLRKA
ncbi:MAG: peptidoglycan recognition family protein [Candidatus Omnitrophota bacterium]